jgi:hypothetical protein
MALTSVGLPPITDASGHASNIATDAARYGRPVIGPIRRGDVAVNMYGHSVGDLGGHVGVLTGQTRIDPATGHLQYGFDSSHRYGGGAGQEWRDADSLTIRRAVAVNAAQRRQLEPDPSPQAGPLGSGSASLPPLAGGAVSINITNSTGGSAIVSSSQLAAGAQ